MWQYAVVSVSEPEHHLEIFCTGSFAGKKAAELNESARNAGVATRYRVVPLKSETTSNASNAWKLREMQRFTSGQYRVVPWCYEPWQKPDHFAHVSNDDPAKLAYTPSPEYGEADRQIRIRPGRYLTQFYSDVLTQDQIREWCAKYTKENEKTPLKFADKPDEIQWVYESGPTSCMSHRASDYGGSCHPTRVYGAGDLAIAYVESKDSDDRVSARALCWPAKKIYGRIYGDENLLTALLHEAGFEESGDASTWNGARLLRVEHDGDQFVAPYLDDPNNSVDDNGKFLIISQGGDIICRQTSGLSDNGGRYRCARCEERCHETYTVGGYEWCSSCYEDGAWHCYTCEECFSGSPYLTTHSGRDICESCSDDYYLCAHCEEYFAEDDITYSTVTHEHYCDRCASRYMERTPCGEIAENKDDCDCDVCKDHRHEDEDEPVNLAPTSPTVHDERQLGLTLAAAATINNAE